MAGAALVLGHEGFAALDTGVALCLVVFFLCWQPRVVLAVRAVREQGRHQGRGDDKPGLHCGILAHKMPASAAKSRQMRKNKLLLIAAATAAGLALVALVAAALAVYFGLYDVSATRQHWQLTHSVLEISMRQSVRKRAQGIDEPHLTDDRMALRGAACFRDKCVQCHGAPGVAQQDIGKSMQPLPGPLVDAMQHWRPRELYWVVRHGLKMTGMPAWEYRLTEEEIWDVVAFLQHLPQLNATQYAQWTQRSPDAPGCGSDLAPPPPAVAANAQRGRQALHQYACTSCHSIPGLTGPAAFVGPPLQGLASRRLLAGELPNTPENLVRWLMHTQKIKPATAMPELGVTPQDAQDMAAYLWTLH